MHLIVIFLRYFEHAFNYKYEKKYDLLLLISQKLCFCNYHFMKKCKYVECPNKICLFCDIATVYKNCIKHEKNVSIGNMQSF